MHKADFEKLNQRKNDLANLPGEPNCCGAPFIDTKMMGVAYFWRQNVSTRKLLGVAYFWAPTICRGRQFKITLAISSSFIHSFTPSFNYFTVSMLLITKVSMILRCRPEELQHRLNHPMARARILNALRGRRVRTTYVDRNGFRKVFHIGGLSVQGANMLMAYGSLPRPYNTSVRY